MSIVKKSSLAAYSDLFNRMLDPTFIVDPSSGIILEANDSAERLFGDGTDKIVGRSILNWCKAEEKHDFEKALRVTMRRYYPRKYESHWLVKGNLFTLEILSCPLKLSNQTEVLQLIARDITFKREAEIKMQELVRELQIVNDKLSLMNRTDEMTGLYNFRHFKAELIAERARAERFRSPFSVIFMDLDNFKHYNDRNGHPAGDQLLRDLGQVLRKHTRASDLLCRYGGEEFVVLCPGVDAHSALALAERLRSAIASSNFSFAEFQPLKCISVSVGVASYPADAMDVDALVDAADHAMYYSKKNGRNRVTLFEDAPKEPEQKTA